MKLLVALFAFLLLMSASTFAAPLRDPGSSAYGLGSTRVDANWLSPTGCGEVVSSGQYAPKGQHLRPHAVPFTVVVDMSAGRCGSPKIIRAIGMVGADDMSMLVSIFFISTTGKILKRENVAPLINGGIINVF